MKKTPVIALVNEIGHLRRHSGEVRHQLYAFAKTATNSALEHLARIDEALRRQEHLILREADALLSTYENKRRSKRKHYGDD